MSMPSVHQSTEAVWPWAAITSGAMYSTGRRRDSVRYLNTSPYDSLTFSPNEWVCAEIWRTCHCVYQRDLRRRIRLRIKSISRDEVVCRSTGIRGGLLTPLCSEWTMAGAVPESPNCLAKSKSDSIMCPDWCKSMSKMWWRLVNSFLGCERPLKDVLLISWL